MKKKKHAARSSKTEKFQPLSANVKLIGVGGGGSNAVSRMARDFVRGVSGLY
jgi:cell division GTPase FtsZ